MNIFNIPFGDTLMTNTHQTRIRSLLAIGLLAAIVFGQQTAMAQYRGYRGTSANGPVDPNDPVDSRDRFNSPDSVLHGRTKHVAIFIMQGLYHRTYNQVTNLAQLSGITSMDFGDHSHFRYNTSFPYYDGVNVLGRVHTKRSISKMMAKAMNPIKITSSLSNREKTRR